MKFEEQAASIIRTTAILCIGAIVVLALAYKLSLEAVLYLGFTPEEARKIAGGVTIATAAFGALFGMMRTVPRETEPTTPQGPWVQKRNLAVEVNKWYEVSRKDDVTGMYHSALPEGDFTGVVRTKTNALKYIHEAPLPDDAVAWLCPDESKFVPLVGNLLPIPSRSKFYLLEANCGYSPLGRVCVIRDCSIGWQSMDGRSSHYLDDEKMVSAWLLLPDPEEECTKQSEL